MEAEFFFAQNVEKATKEPNKQKCEIKKLRSCFKIFIMRLDRVHSHDNDCEH